MNRKYLCAIDEPRIIIDKMKGLHPFYSYLCIKSKQLINPKTIIDVGANKGRFMESMRKYFPQAKIISFEPIIEFKKKLIKKK